MSGSLSHSGSGRRAVDLAPAAAAVPPRIRESCASVVRALRLGRGGPVSIDGGLSANKFSRSWPEAHGTLSSSGHYLQDVNGTERWPPLHLGG